MVSLMHLRLAPSAPDLDIQAVTLRTPLRVFLYPSTVFFQMAGVLNFSSLKEHQNHLLSVVVFLEIQCTSSVA